MGKQLVNFITCGCEMSAPFFVIYKYNGLVFLTFCWIHCVYYALKRHEFQAFPYTHLVIFGIPVLNGRYILKNLWKAITTRNEIEIDWTDLIKTHPTLHVVWLNHFCQKRFCTVEMIQQTILPMQSESAKYGMNSLNNFSFMEQLGLKSGR